MPVNLLTVHWWGQLMWPSSAPWRQHTKETARTAHCTTVSSLPQSLQPVRKGKELEYYEMAFPPGPQITENRAGSRCLCSQDSELMDGSVTQLLMRQDSWDIMSKDLYFCLPLYHHRASLLALTVKNLPAMQENQVQSPGLKILWRRKQLPTLVFLPEEFYGQRSLSGYSMWGHKESDTAEQLTLSLSYY